MDNELFVGDSDSSITTFVPESIPQICPHLKVPPFANSKFCKKPFSILQRWEKGQKKRPAITGLFRIHYENVSCYPFALSVCWRMVSNSRALVPSGSGTNSTYRFIESAAALRSLLMA